MIYRLFCGSRWSLNIERIRIMEDKSNLKGIVEAITALDSSISGVSWRDFNYNYLDTKSNHGSLLVELTNSVIDNNGTIKLNQYILNTFHCFTKSKTRLKFDFHEWAKLDWKDKRSSLVLFSFLEGNYDGREYQRGNEDEIVDENSMEMEFNPDLLKVFPNIKEILITSYPPKFSLSHFLSIIDTTSVKCVSIGSQDWSARYSEDLKKKIINEYNSNNFKIPFEDREIKIEVIMTM